MRIAIIGGTDYDQIAFEDFLYKLNSKYPDAVIVTGTAIGQSAEKQATSLLTGLGHTIEVPEPDQYLSTIMSKSDLQVRDVICGAMRVQRKGKSIESYHVTPRPDIIVTVGNPDSARARLATTIWKQLYAWEPDGTNTPFIPLHNVATVVKKKKTARKPKKKTELLAV